MQETRQLRVALTVTDFDLAVAFYRDVFGLAVEQQWNTEQRRGIVLRAQKATLEIVNDPQAAMIDQIEAGRRVAGPIRLAFQVEDVQSAVAEGQRAGANLIGGPVKTPWGHRNARLTDIAGNQLTLFEVPRPE
jgi:lactoylglutathione lyase